MRRVLLCLAIVALGATVLAGSASAGPSPGDLTVNVNDLNQYSAAPGVDSLSGTATLDGVLGWDFQLQDYDVTVTNPSFEVNSALPASAFPGLGVAAFPVFGVPQATLGPGGTYEAGVDLVSTLPVSFASGVDVTRSVTPTSAPVGGGTQQVTVSITPVSAPQFYKVQVGDPVPGAAVTSSSGPDNLDSGEHLGGGGGGYVLFDPVVGKTYTFGFTLSIPNPFGYALRTKPEVDVDVANSSASCCQGPASSITIPVASLDGQVASSVDQTVGAWEVDTYHHDSLTLGGLLEAASPTSKDDCKNGGWRNYKGFRNQGGCVSYVEHHNGKGADG